MYRFWHRKTRPTSPYEQTGFPTRALAGAAEWTKRTELGALKGRHAGGPPDVALSEYVARWLEDVTPHLAPATVTNYRERLEGHVLPELGALPLREVTRPRIRALLTARLEAGHKPNSVRAIRAALSACLADAHEAGLIPDNPCLGIGRGARRRGERATGAEIYGRIRVMTAEQRDRLLAAAATHEPDWAPYFTLLAKAGLRPGEALALQVVDVDWSKAIARVERAWVKGRIRPTKTHEARTVELSPACLEALALQRAHVRAAALERGGRRGISWLFPNSGGLRPRDLARAGKAFRRAAKKAKLAGFTPYSLRHTWASLRLAAGAPITYVSAQLGHATPATTLRYYARWIPSADGRRWVERDGRSWQSSGRQPQGGGP
jgi:integrase